MSSACGRRCCDPYNHTGIGCFQLSCADLVEYGHIAAARFFFLHVEGGDTFFFSQFRVDDTSLHATSGMSF